MLITQTHYGLGKNSGTSKIQDFSRCFTELPFVSFVKWFSDVFFSILFTVLCLPFSLQSFVLLHVKIIILFWLNIIKNVSCNIWSWGLFWSVYGYLKFCCTFHCYHSYEYLWLFCQLSVLRWSGTPSSHHSK